VTRALFLFLLVCALNLAPVAFALEGAGDWSKQIDSNGRITLTDGTILIQGSDNAGPGYPTMNTVTGLTTVSSTGETVSFDWTYWTTDSAYWDRPQMLLDGVWSDLANNGQNASGTRAVYVTAGQAFGFRILSLDSCCGAGYLQISNTTWVVGSPTPTPTPTPEPTPTPIPTPEPTAVVPSPGPTPVSVDETEQILIGEAVTDGVTPRVGGVDILLLLGATAAAALVVRSRLKRAKNVKCEFPETEAPRKQKR
jgi:hypothetical protein